MHSQKGKYKSVRIISENSAIQMQTKLSDEEGYGLALETTEKLIPGEVMCGHTGSAYGLYSAMFFNAQKEFGIVVICNGVGSTYDSGFNNVIKTAVNKLYEAFIK